MRYRQKDVFISEVVTKNRSINCMFMPAKPSRKYIIQAVPAEYTVESTAVQFGNLMRNYSCKIELLSSCYQT